MIAYPHSGLRKILGGFVFDELTDSLAGLFHPAAIGVLAQEAADMATTADHLRMRMERLSQKGRLACPYLGSISALRLGAAQRLREVRIALPGHRGEIRAAYLKAL